VKGVGRAGNVVHMVEKRNELRVLMGKPEIVYREVSTVLLGIQRSVQIYLIFVDPCIIVQFIKKNPTRCNNVSKCYYSIFI